MYYLKNILREKLNEIRYGTLKDLDFASVGRMNLNKTPCFVSNIKKGKVNIIAEIKKASPSKGSINTGLDIKEASSIYDEFRSFICAVSVLTEPVYFKGDPKHVEEVKKSTDLPVLRKDFIFNESQVYESVLLGADCILLISSILCESRLKKLYLLARGLGLDVLIEVHTFKDLKKALSTDAELIGINNRNLRTMKVEPENIFNILKNDCKTGCLPDSGHADELNCSIMANKTLVCESGIEKVSYIKKLYDEGINVFLMGSYFMRAQNLRGCLKEFEDELKQFHLI